MSYHHMMLKGRHLYDPLIKIPLIVKYPGQQAAGQTDSFLSENIDVAPTVLELCGQPIPPTMQGRSLLGNDHRQFAFSELQFGSQTNPKIGYMLRSDSYKLLVYGSMQDCAFYDLKKILSNSVMSPKSRIIRKHCTVIRLHFPILSCSMHSEKYISTQKRRNSGIRKF